MYGETSDAIRNLMIDGVERTLDEVVKGTGCPRRSVSEALRCMLRGGWLGCRLDPVLKDRAGRPVRHYAYQDPDVFPRAPVAEIVAAAMQNRHPLEQVWRV